MIKCQMPTKASNEIKTYIIEKHVKNIAFSKPFPVLSPPVDVPMPDPAAKGSYPRVPGRIDFTFIGTPKQVSCFAPISTVSSLLFSVDQAEFGTISLLPEEKIQTTEGSKLCHKLGLAFLVFVVFLTVTLTAILIWELNLTFKEYGRKQLNGTRLT